MSATIAIPNSDLDFDNGTFDSAAFTSKALADWQSLAAVIDHSLLKQDATRKHVESLCAEAARYRFACIFVNPVWTATAASLLSAPAFPSAQPSASPSAHRWFPRCVMKPKRFFVSALASSAWSLPIGQMKSGQHHAVHHAIHSLAAVAHHHGAALKVNLETCLLSMQEKLRASEDRNSGRRRFHQHRHGFCLRRRNSS
ncbi:MAG: hypothetical protein WDM87_16885 [Terracidiphilus sp.]